jgi:hypothetical protein
MEAILQCFRQEDRKKFDEMMLDIPRLYIPACSYSVQYVRRHPILWISILLYHFKQLTDCSKQVEQIGASRMVIVVRERKGMGRLTALPSIEAVMIPMT